LFNPTGTEEAVPARQIHRGKGKRTSRSRSDNGVREIVVR
jgi:hypothetical protein